MFGANRTKRADVSGPRHAKRTGARLVSPIAIALGVAALAVFGITSAAVGSTSRGKSKRLSVIRLSNTLVAGDEIPLVYGDAAGVWKRYGIDLKLETVSTAIQFTSLGAGQADVATGSSNSLDAAAQGAPIKVVGDIGPDFIQLLAQHNIRNVAALKGQTLGSSAPGSVTDDIITSYLRSKGLSPSAYHVTFFSGSFPAVITALESGQIAATTAGYPFIALARAKNPGLHPIATISSAPIGILGGNVMSVNSHWAAAHAAVLSQFITAWNAASAAAQKHPRLAITALAKAAGVSVAIATTWFHAQTHLDAWKPLTASQYKIIRASLATQYPILAHVPYGRYIDNAYFGRK